MSASEPVTPAASFALEYHETTKHAFGRFARSLGYLDWASQPNPFRHMGASLIALPRGGEREADAAAPAASRGPAAIDDRSVAWFLRYSMGLSAWKAYRDTRWALRVNPSSGNLHPTEAYIVFDGRVCHYAPLEHAIEERAVLPAEAWRAWLQGSDGFLVALTSIVWREAWKYGERAFRYCQHDAGHAIAAMRFSAGLFGWTLRLLPNWPDAQIAALLGVDRTQDFPGEVEPEEPECVGWVSTRASAVPGDSEPLVAAAGAAEWHGTANQLSVSHVAWPVIDRVIRATRRPPPEKNAATAAPRQSVPPLPPVTAREGGHPSWGFSREIILQRRSAVAFDARSTLPRDRFLSMLARLHPTAPPWDVIDWPPHVHLAIFVHRVEGLTPGIYAYLRDAAVLEEWRTALRREFLWERVSNDSNDGLFLLLPADVTWAATRVSCDQDIAGDGFFSLGMIGRLASSLRARGDWFYRRLFWECGIVGQILYLAAEAAGARGTGIGCFYDDPVHEILGLSGHEWQSLYHFSMGVPVEDGRLTTEPGYAWEVRTN